MLPIRGFPLRDINRRRVYHRTIDCQTKLTGPSFIFPATARSRPETVGHFLRHDQTIHRPFMPATAIRLPRFRRKESEIHMQVRPMVETRTCLEARAPYCKQLYTRASLQACFRCAKPYSTGTSRCHHRQAGHCRRLVVRTKISLRSARPLHSSLPLERRCIPSGSDRISLQPTQRLRHFQTSR